ncbi:RusA family crossover junction endodeoxyribonuclease [Gordonia sihwensis]|nr:RusA family crossover junction endodeoxyribonuclease [Gordonia sihwensis]AUH68500.1 RusA family crossover junction endodeoxyribonuclease [Gordonia sp. YC-JH1]
MTDRHVFVEGRPAPQGSKRHIGNGRMLESSKAVGPWRTEIASEARRRGGMLPPGPVGANLDFVMPRPKQTAKRRPTPPAVKRPDLDKLTRAVFDAITGIWITDDSHIVTLHATKRIAEPDEPAGVAISLTALTRPHCFVCHRDDPPPRPHGCGPECHTREGEPA